MASDRDLVSKEDHEMNYLLQKWEKKQNKSNREILVSELEKFKKGDDYKPHNRENFYKYIDDNKIKNKLESAEKNQEEKAEKKEEKKVLDSKAKSSVKKQKASGNKIKIKLIKSPFGYKQDQIGTVHALGLKRLNQVKEHVDNSIIRGMIFKVKHLVEVVE